MKDIVQEIKNNTKQPVELFSNLALATVNGHILHLQTKSYAQHMALGDFYTAIQGLADELIETWQGKYVIFTGYKPVNLQNNGNVVSYLNELRRLVESNRYTELKKEDTHLQNITDEIIALIDKTLYKINNLK